MTDRAEKTTGTNQSVRTIFHPRLIYKIPHIEGLGSLAENY